MSFHQMTNVFEEKNEGCYVESSSGKKRQRFYIELTPGETTIVSWKKLLRDGKEIDDVDVTTSSGTHHSSAIKTQDDISEAGRWDNLTDEKHRDKRGAGSAGKKKMRISREAVNNGLAGKHWEDYGNAKAFSTFKFPQHSLSSEMANDHQLGGLRYATLLMNSKKSALLGKQSCYSPVRVVEGAAAFPVKTNHGNLRKSSEKKIMNVEAGNASSKALSEISAIRSVPLQTYHRSRNLMNGKQTKVARVQDDSLINQTVKANTNKNANPVPYLNRKVADSGERYVPFPSPCGYRPVKKAALDHRVLQAKTPHPHARSVKFTLSSERNLTTTGPRTHIKALRMEAPEKTNVKIRFHLKQERDISEQQGAKNSMNHPRPAASVCKQPS